MYTNASNKKKLVEYSLNTLGMRAKSFVNYFFYVRHSGGFGRGGGVHPSFSG